MRAVEALKAYLPPHATVVRDGLEQDIDARELVPGDVMLIREGDRVSADGRVLVGARRDRPLGADRRVGAGLARRRRTRRWDAAAGGVRLRVQRRDLHGR